MAPKQTRKRKSTSGGSATLDAFPEPPKLVPTKAGSPLSTRTPIVSPSKKNKVSLLQSQKQALLDNLQLEITERARKLRALYNLQAQGLRTRLEIRVHRIPAALRKANIADLLEKYAEHKMVAPPPVPQKSPKRSTIHHDKNTITVVKATGNGKKRTSEDFQEDSGKENAPEGNTAKRVKSSTVQGPAPAKSRVASKVLSPKSNNPRPLQQSPFKGMSPTKSGIARPASPLKSAPAIPTAAVATTASSLAKTAEKAKPKAATTRPASRQTAKTGTTTTTTVTTTARAASRQAENTASAAPKVRPASRQATKPAPAATTSTRAPSRQASKAATTTTMTANSRSKRAAPATLREQATAQGEDEGEEEDGARRTSLRSDASDATVITKSSKTKKEPAKKETVKVVPTKAAPAKAAPAKKQGLASKLTSFATKGRKAAENKATEPKSSTGTLKGGRSLRSRA